ncbi:MAG: hypothetical protein WCQ26_12260 [Pseudanabaena sp. ELA748]
MTSYSQEYIDRMVKHFALMAIEINELRIQRDILKLKLQKCEEKLTQLKIPPELWRIY